MKRFWLVYCPHCNKAVTSAQAPKTADFTKKVKCILCNGVIDANNGRFVFHPTVVKQEKVDLLEVY